MRKEKWLSRFLDNVESIGNRLPQPIVFFAYLCVITLILSGLGAYFDLAIADPRLQGNSNNPAEGMIGIVNLLDAAGFEKIVTNLVGNFVNFGPLGVTLVAILGIGIAEYSGWLPALMKQLLLKTPKRLITSVVIFVSVLSSIAMPLGYVVIIPLSALLFYSIGRHPLAGLAASFAGVGAGYSANILIGVVDTLLSGISQNAARIVDASYSVTPDANWYFMFVSTFLIVAVATYVTEKIIIPRLGEYHPTAGDVPNLAAEFEPLSEQESTALFYGNLSFLSIFLTFISISFFYNDAAGPDTPLILKGIVAFIFVSFCVPGLIYGYIAGKFKSDKDVIAAMTQSISSMSGFIVLMFFVSQFVNWFDWSNIALVLSIYAASAIKEANVSGPALFLYLIMFTVFLNFFISCAVVKWSIIAPIVIPIFMFMGYSPEVTQSGYRIGDSLSNIITPMMPFFGMIILVASRYIHNVRIGTILSLMLPYSLFIFIFWVSLFMIWVFILDFPLGPGVESKIDFSNFWINHHEAT